MARRLDEAPQWSWRDKDPLPVMYPAYADWCNGDAWELDEETDILEDPLQFRARLYRNIRALSEDKETLHTRRVTRDGRRYMVIQVTPRT